MLERLERCQLEESPYLYRWPFGPARRAKRAVARWRHPRPSTVAAGAPSQFAEGDWVRVRPHGAIRATLDANGAHRGMPFLEAQWTYEGTFRVERPVRRILDHDGSVRRISGAVALAGVTCDGRDGKPGCGRACSMYYRDEWLEPSSPEAATPLPASRFATVRSVAHIRSTLDRHGRLDGISFRPEMERFAGMRLPVLRRIEEPPQSMPRWKRPAGEWYALDGSRCGGEPFATKGGCDRNCAFAWHRSWLDLEEPAG